MTAAAAMGIEQDRLLLLLLLDMRKHGSVGVTLVSAALAAAATARKCCCLIYLSLHLKSCSSCMQQQFASMEKVWFLPFGSSSSF